LFVECAYNVVQWTDMPEVGHFATFQQPGPIHEDLQRFLRLIRRTEPGTGAQTQRRNARRPGAVASR
jgi:hypothetical protein